MASQAQVQNKKRGDTIAIVALVIGLILVIMDVLGTFFVAPIVKGALLNDPVVINGEFITNKLLFSQKIFYLHVPVAVASFVVMAAAAFHEVKYLRTREAIHDLRASQLMLVTLIFILMTMVSGDLWTRFEWGVWWVWEPRLTTYFILMLFVIGYFVLRNAIEDVERRAVFSSIYGLIAFVDAPISFFITRMIPSSVHPVVFRTDSGLPPNMLIPFLMGVFGMMFIAYGISYMRIKVAEQSAEIEDLKDRYERCLSQRN